MFKVLNGSSCGKYTKIITNCKYKFSFLVIELESSMPPKTWSLFGQHSEPI
jgi:hypothetical protein